MSLFSLMATLGLDSSNYESGLDEAERKGSSFGSKLSTGLKTAAKAGAAALTAVTGAAAAFGIASIKSGQDFDVGMSQIAATLGLTMSDIRENVNGAGDTFDALRKKAQQMGAETNFTATQAAEGLNILAMSGFDANQSMDMLADVLHLAAAGSMDMASAAGYISGTLKGFNDATKDSGYYADLMAKGATLANTSVSQLGEAMSAGAAGAAAYNQSADSMTVALLRLAEQGDVGSAAGTALSAAMKNLYTPTDQAASALKELGVAAYDESGAARDFNDVVNELNESLAGMSDEQANAYKQTIFGIQGLNAYNKMTVTGTDKQKKWAKALASASDGAGEAAKQYETMTDNLQGDLDILSSAFDGLKLSISDALTGTAREFVQFGSNALTAINQGFQTGGIDGAMSAVGDMLADGIDIITDKLPEMLSAGISLMKALVSGIVDSAPLLIQTGLDMILMLGESLAENLEPLAEAATSIITSLGDWLAEYSSVLVDTAVEIIIALANGLTNPENISSIVDSAIFLMLSLTDSLIEAIPTLLEAVPTIFDNLMTAVTENLPRILEAGLEIITMLAQGITENLPTILESGAGMLNNLIQGITENLPLILETAITVVETLINLLIENLPQFLDTGMQMIESAAQGILDNLPVILESIITIITMLLDYITENLPEFLTLGIDLITKLANGVLENLPTIISAITNIIMALVNFIIQNLPMIIQMGIRLVMSLAQGLIKNLPAIIQAAMQLISALLNGIIKNLPQIIQMGIKLIGELVVGLIRAIPQIIAALPQIFRAIINGFKEVDWGSIGKNIIDGIKNGVIQFASNLWQAAKDAVNGAISSVKNFLGIHSPSRVFRDQIGKQIGLGLALGIEQSADEAVTAATNMAKDVVSEMDALNDFNADLSGAIDLTGNSPSEPVESNRSVVINVYGAEGQNINELAEIISEKIAFGYRQEQMAWA